jgi:hypothetical protein
MNKLTRTTLHIASWALALCAGLVSPVILIYSAPLVVGAVSDIIHAGGGTIATAIITAGTLLTVA